MVHFFWILKRTFGCEDHPDFLMVKIFSSQDGCRFIDVHDIDREGYGCWVCRGEAAQKVIQISEWRRKENLPWFERSPWTVVQEGVLFPCQLACTHPQNAYDSSFNHYFISFPPFFWGSFPPRRWLLVGIGKEMPGKARRRRRRIFSERFDGEFHFLKISWSRKEEQLMF